MPRCITGTGTDALQTTVGMPLVVARYVGVTGPWLRRSRLPDAGRCLQTDRG